MDSMAANHHFAEEVAIESRVVSECQLQCIRCEGKRSSSTIETESSFLFLFVLYANEPGIRIGEYSTAQFSRIETTKRRKLQYIFIYQIN